MPAPTRRDGNALYYSQIDPRPTHFIEQSVRVYLRMSDDGTRWIVDGPSVDGHPLDSAREDLHASNTECACSKPDECLDVLHAAAQLPLPTGAELAKLIVEALDVPRP